MKELHSFYFPCLFLALVMILISFPLMQGGSEDPYEIKADGRFWSEFSSSEFNGGDGTQGNPYQIATAEQFARMHYSAGMESRYFILNNSIDLSAHRWIEGTSKSANFVFDGRNYNINGLTFLDDSKNTVYAMFGDVSGVLKNFTLTNASYTSDIIGSRVQSVTFLVRTTTATTIIENVHIYSGHLNAKSVTWFGGLVVWHSGLMKNCSTNLEVNIQNSSFLGGIAAYSNGAKIEQSYSYGNYSSSNIQGGIIGNIGSSKVEIVNSFSKIIYLRIGSLRIVNGLVGWKNEESYNLHISNSYYNGNASATHSLTDGTLEISNVFKGKNDLVGLPTNIWAINEDVNGGAPFIKNSYWN